MGCSRGKAAPNTATAQRLYMDSGGFCQRPTCARKLYEDVGSKSVHFAEMAHIFAATDGGPRTDTKLSENARGAYENLILLCANCHTLIDKAPEDFPDDQISKWKVEHVSRLNGLFGVRRYDTRTEACDAVDASLRENRIIHEKYNPSNEYNDDPESDLALVWQNKVLETILPNNRKILVIMEANRHLMTQFECEVMAEYQQHISDLEARHLTGEPVANAQRFPQGMVDLFRE